jgi:hypothetical protein
MDFIPENAGKSFMQYFNNLVPHMLENETETSVRWKIRGPQM